MIFNPLNNISSYFLFPFNMQKNIFFIEDKYFNSFKEFIYRVYKSKLMIQIFYYFEEFRDFIYPFEGEDKDIFLKKCFY